MPNEADNPVGTKCRSSVGIRDKTEKVVNPEW